MQSEVLPSVNDTIDEPNKRGVLGILFVNKNS